MRFFQLDCTEDLMVSCFGEIPVAREIKLNDANKNIIQEHNMDYRDIFFAFARKEQHNLSNSFCETLQQMVLVV